MSTETENVDIPAVVEEVTAASGEPAPPVTVNEPVEPAAAAPAPAKAPVKVEKTYAEEFPSLGGPNTNVPAWTNTAPGVKRIKSSEVSITFSIPFEEQQYRPGQAADLGKGTSADRGKLVCQKIMRTTSTMVEYSTVKDKSIIVVVTGKQSDVNEAKKQIMAQLTQQGSINVFIPKAHHRFILGKQAETLKALERETGAKISVPKISDEAKEEPIVITGAKEAMQEAKARIEKISAGQFERHRETFNAPIWTHPFIRGGNDSNLNALKTKYGIVAIDVPPPSAEKTEVVVRGPEKGAVAAAIELKELVKRKEKNCKTVDITIDKKQHKFVIGPRGRNIQDVLEKTGVSVEVPAQADASPVIKLRGEQADMGAAITAVYGYASSHQDAFIPAEEWMHRLLIGQKGQTIREITEKFGYDKVQVDFKSDDKKCGIQLEGTPSELEAVQKELERRIQEIKSTTSHSELDVPAAYHPHLIGKGGSNITKLKDEHNVIIKIPQDAGQKIWIEGPPEGVKKATAALKQLADRIADEDTDSIQLNRRFHRQLIGPGGENIRKLRDQFPGTQITVPDENSKSDTISIRGPSKELKRAKVELAKMAKDIEERGYRIDVPILKEYHRNIIGKSGENIKRIRDETSCQIELPKQDSDSEIITIIGRKADAERARKEIRKIEKDLVNIEEIQVKVETKLHQALIGAGGKAVKKLQGTDCIIHFPSDGSENVTIRGKAEAVQGVKKALEDEAAQLRLQSFTATVQAAPEYHRFLIGRGGSNMKSIRDQTGCRIAVPGPKDDKKDIITILGTKEGVAKAKALLEKNVAELKDEEEHEVTVPEKFHKNFTARRAELINRISDECGGVQISFPRHNKEGEEAAAVSEAVKVKGPANCVQAAITMIKENVDNFEAQVTETIDIEKLHHREIIGKGGKQVQEIQTEYNVNIKFPGRDDDPANCTIHISGRKEKVEEAKVAILALVPVTVKYELEAIYHRDLIGEKGSGLKQITDDFPIRITVPKKDDEEADPNVIILAGKQDLVNGVIAALDEKKEEWVKNAEDRERRGYTETIEVHQMFHSKIIGLKGATIDQLSKEHDARITLPGRANDKNKRDDKADLAEDEIRITGYPECVEAMKAAIMKIVSDLESHIVQDVLINKKVHPRIIGNRGSNVRKIMKDFGVEIKIGRSPADPDKVSVIGPSEKVEECIDHLLNMEEEILQEIADREEDDVYKPQKADRFKEKKQGGKNKNDKGYVISGAPWEEDFPTLSEKSTSAGVTSNWRPK